MKKLIKILMLKITVDHLKAQLIVIFKQKLETIKSSTANKCCCVKQQTIRAQYSFSFIDPIELQTTLNFGVLSNLFFKLMKKRFVWCAEGMLRPNIGRAMLKWKF